MIETAGFVALAGGITVAAGAGVDPTTLTNYGVLGILVVLLLTRRVVPLDTFKECQAENERLREEVAAMRIAQDEKVTPMLYATAQVMERVVVLLGKPRR